MSSFDEIARERQRIAGRLARIDEERARLADELAELDAAERVLKRLSRAQATAHAPLPRRSRTRLPPPRKTERPSLGDAALRAVAALGSDVSAAEVRSYLEREFGMRVRPNHLGMALQRHRRAGRLEQHDRHWSMPDAPAGTARVS